MARIHSEQIVDHLAFRADWVRHALGVQQSDLALISVKGDSMEPTLSNGDLILLDMHSGKVEDNAIYALQHNGTLLVKRIQRRLDGSVVVSSDNPRYESEAVGIDAVDSLRVVGRVVWAGRRM
jgi:phage repressor protein C with HTH and peptisase S24 domain